MITLQIKLHTGQLLQIDTESQGMASEWLFRWVMSQGSYGLEVTRAMVADGSGSQPQRVQP